MSAHHLRLSVVSVALLVLQGCATPHPRPVVEPLPHLVQVDEGLSRGGQPSSEGIRQLAGMGVRTIVALRRRSREMDDERRLAEQLGIQWIGMPVWSWWVPSRAQMRQFLAVAADPDRRPVFVHCLYGRNRTGVMAAVYRINHDGWTPAQAYAEARQQGLVPWNLLTRYVILHRIPRDPGAR